MPISSNASSIDKKRTFKVVNKVLTPSGSTAKRSQIPPQTTVIPNVISSEPNYDARSVTVQTKSDGTICVFRAEKDTKIDRLNLDRCSLNRIPLVVDDHNYLRLFSLQHNLISNLTLTQVFPNLVFLDVYDNEIELIESISMLDQLRVLLIGKNRLRKITGLGKLNKLEVLDLHGNLISHVSGLSGLSKLKVLNLAGNKIISIGEGDVKGLDCLNELNLRRNGLKKIQGFEDISALQKLYLSHNDIKRIDDMITIIKCLQLKELTMENNPVSVTSDCVSFLVAQLLSLSLVNGIQVTENFRKTALVWKRNKLQAMKTSPQNAGRDKVISNAKTNWELLRTQSKSLTAKGDHHHTSHPKYPKSAGNSTHKIPSLGRHTARIHLPRTNSQDTTESSSLSNSEYVCFPPIVVAASRRRSKSSAAEAADTSSVSSNDPHVDSSVASLHSEDDEEEGSDSSEASDGLDVDVLPMVDVRTSDKVMASVDVVVQSVVDAASVGALADCVKEADGANVEFSHSETASSASNAIPSSSDGTGSELSHSNSSIKSRRGIRSAFAASTVTRAATAGRLGRRPMQSRATSVRVTKSRSPSTGSSTGVASNVAPTSNITYQGAAAPAPGSGGVTAAGPSARDKEQGGDYLVEICGRHLNVYGQGALRHLDKAWSPAKAADVTHVNFHYANFNGIATILPRLKHRFPHIVHLSFTGNSLSTLGQLNALAEVQGLTSIFVHDEGNPVVANQQWRKYAIYRLSHWGLKCINGEEISIEEEQTANEEFRSLSDLVLYTLPDPILEPLIAHLKLDSDELTTDGNTFSKRKLLLADRSLRSVITKEALQWKRSLNSQDEFALRQRSRTHISTILDEMVHSQKKLRELERLWPQILRDIIQNSLLDYTQFDMYKKAKLQEFL